MEDRHRLHQQDVDDAEPHRLTDMAKRGGRIDTAQNSKAAGTIDANMNGWRRPQRELVRSDHDPTSGSNNALTIRPAASAMPTHADPFRRHPAHLIVIEQQETVGHRQHDRFGRAAERERGLEASGERGHSHARCSPSGRTLKTGPVSVCEGKFRPARRSCRWPGPGRTQQCSPITSRDVATERSDARAPSCTYRALTKCSQRRHPNDIHHITAWIMVSQSTPICGLAQSLSPEWLTMMTKYSVERTNSGCYQRYLLRRNHFHPPAPCQAGRRMGVINVPVAGSMVVMNDAAMHVKGRIDWRSLYGLHQRLADQSAPKGKCSNVKRTRLTLQYTTVCQYAK